MQSRRGFDACYRNKSGDGAFEGEDFIALAGGQ